MELNITKFIKRHSDHMCNFSDSVANSGLDNIGSITWTNAQDVMFFESDWLTSDLDALRAYFAGFGAWDREELAEMCGRDLNALLVQFIAGDYQERESAEERGELEEWEENFGGRIYKGDVEGDGMGEWFFYVGM